MKKRKGTALMALLLCFCLTSGFICNGVNLSTAAKLMKTYRVALQGFQDADTSAFQANLESDATHKSMSAKEERLAKIGQIVDTAMLTSDKATVISQVNAAGDILNNLETQDIITITDPTKKALIEDSFGLLKNLVAQVQIALGKTAGA